MIYADGEFIYITQALFNSNSKNIIANISLFLVDKNVKY